MKLLEYALLMIHWVENKILCRDATAKELKLAVARSLGNDAWTGHFVLSDFNICFIGKCP